MFQISQSTVTRSLITPLHISGEDMEAKYQLRFVNQGDSFSTVYAKFDLTLDDSNKLDVHFASNDSDANTDFDEGSLAWNETLFAFNILTAGNKLTGYFNNLAFPDLNETMVVLKQTLVNTGPYGLRSSVSSLSKNFYLRIPILDQAFKAPNLLRIQFTNIFRVCNLSNLS